MSDLSAPKAAAEAALEARLALREEKVAGLRSSLSERKRALLDRLVEGRSAVPRPRATIANRGETGPAVLSFAQERLWFLDRLQPGSSLYNLPTVLRLAGLLDRPALARSLGEIVRRHEALRTTFETIGGEPRQVLGPARPVSVPVVDLAGVPAARREPEARRLAVAESLQPFDLTSGPLLRTTFLRLAEEEGLVLFNLHHIVGDGWSTGLLVGEIATLYRAFVAGGGPPLPELPLQYADFAVWQRGWLAGEVLAGELAHWRRELDGAPDLLELPADRPRPPVQSFRGDTLRFALPRSLAAALSAFAERQGATLFMVLLAGFQALLGRLTGQNDLLVGSAVANRTQGETEGLIGFFVNLLVLRGRLAGDPSGWELLRRARTTALSAYAHQDLPFEKLVEELRLGRSRGHNPLVQAVLVLQNAPRGALELPGLTLRPLELPVVTAKFDFGLAVTEAGGELVCQLEYATDLFDRTTVTRLAGYFERLLAGFMEQPERRLSDLPLLGVAEEHQLQVEWSGAVGGKGEAEPVWKGFERQARSRPAAVALALADGTGASLTYAELDSRARRLAGRLRRLGVGPEVRVGLFAERSFDLAVAILGIWQAGGAYLPLDPGLPSARLAFMIEDALGGVGAVLLAHESLRERLRDLPVSRLRVVFLATERPEEQEDDGRVPQDGEERSASRPEDLAYLIYTSGTTGRPKAVAVEHGSLSQTLAATGEAFGFGTTDRMPCLAPFSFDIFLFELLSPLLAGGTVVLFPLRPALDVRELAVALPGITAFHAVPALMREVIAAVAALGDGQGVASALRLAFVGGDAVPPELLAGMRQAFPAARVVALYGPTEGTILAARHESTEWAATARHSIGRPLPGAWLRIFGRGGEPVPIGVPGELCLGGAGVARGYLGRPELSAERFVPSRIGEPGGRLYRTGDLVRFRPSGVLEFLGRIDTQVKVRGFRIELGEIEAVLSAHPEVDEAVVLAREDRPGERRLVAYVVGGPRENLKGYLRERLPDYMVPTAIVSLTVLPLTNHGKVDRAALPAPDSGEDETVRAAPRTAAEELMVGLWSQLLGVAVERIGVEASFFDLGGHSLLATRLVSRVREAFGVELPLLAVFETPTVAGLAGLAERELARGPGSHQAALPPPLISVERSGPLPLSFAQERLWFLDQLEPGSAAYNIPLALRLTGALNVWALAASLAAILRRHEALRTLFRPGAQGPQQVVSPPRPAELPLLSLEALPEDLKPGVVARLAGEEAERPFDLARGPLTRGLAIRVGADSHLLMLNFHHIVTDGWSLGVLVREIAESYTALLAGRAPRLPDLAIQYADYAIWQRRWLAGEPLARQVSWWQERLAGAPEVIELPTDRPRPPFAGSAGRMVSLDLSPAVADGVQELARESAVTPFMVLLALFAVLLQKITGNGDLVVGSPIANRQRLETEGLIGLFVNSLALRVEIAEPSTFGELLASVRATTLGAYAHQDLPFEMVVEALAPTRSLGHTPLFQVMLALQNTPVSALELRGLHLAPFPLGGGRAKFDLTLNLVPGVSRMAGTLEYRVDLFDRSTVERLAGGFERLLTAAVSLPRAMIVAAMPVADLPLLSAAERHQVLREWNEATSASSGGAPLVAELFAGQVLRRPDAIALAARGWQLSYGELAARSRRLARRLRALGVGPDVRVGIAIGASPRRIEAILAVVQAAGAYVSLDPDYPEERLAYALADAATPVLLTERALLARSPAIAAKSTATVICLDDAGEEESAENSALQSALSERPAPASAGADHLAYVIYTSGSTGRPKGVEISHRGLANLVRWHRERYSVGPEDRSTLVASPGFDASVLEMWPYLASGASLYQVEAETRLSPETMLGVWAEAGVTLSFLPTPLAEAVLEAGASAASGTPLRILFTGGDRLYRRPDAGAPFFLENHYGPTEYSVVSTVQSVVEEAGGAPPIGRPVASTRLAVVGLRGELVPAGVAGELYVGGAGLARGYLGRPDLTAERFVPDPLAAAGEPGARFYRTGDLVRWLADGSLEFLGRTDHQVKIRGFRIEMGEIEAVLAQHPEILQAAVLLRVDRPGDRRLVAYVVPRLPGGLSGLSAADLRSHLKARLPDFMLPSSFVLLPELPLTPNGKVDRRALPAPELRQGEEERVAPRTPAEELLVDLWAGLLGVEQVGIHENFFELGGHSLLATRVVSRVREVFGVEIPVRALFDSPTVAGLADLLAALLAAGTGETPPPPLQAVPRPAGDLELPLSFAQERLWFLDRLEPGGSAYNISAAVRLVGSLDVAAFGAALGEVVRRHEALRTGFQEGVGGRPVQVIRGWSPVGLPVIDLSVPSGARETAVRRLAVEEAGRPFDLALGRPVRAALLRLGGTERVEHVLLLTLHHIAADGWSVGVLVRELAALYEAFLLPELPIQYADFAVWQRAWLTGAVLDAQTVYWRQALGGAPTLELPTDRPRPAVRSSRGARRGLALSPGLSEELRRFARGQGATAFMALLTAFEILLGRMCSQEDVLVGSPIANRNHREIEGLIGFFVNTLVLRGDLSGDPDFPTLLGRTREVTLGAYAHQDLPFEKLVEELAPVRDGSRTPLFQVMFTLQEAAAAALRFGDLAAEWLEVEVETAKFDLTLSLGGGKESGFVGEIEYSTDLFDASTVMRLAGQLQTLLVAATADPGRRLAHLPLLSAAERHQLQVEWSALPSRGCGVPLQARLAAQSARTPDAVAVVDGDRRLTYGELAVRSAKVAAGLEIRPGGRVGLSLERSPELVVGLLGILAAGGTYVPIDPAYPAERQEFMLRDAGLAAMVNEEWLAATAENAETIGPAAGAGPADSLYVIYTSGSTGQPKGAVVRQRAFSGLVDWYIEELGLNAADRLLLLSSASFDLTQKNFFAPLLVGAELHLAPSAYDPLELRATIEREGITRLNCTPSAFYPLAEDDDPAALASLRSVVLGGEPIAVGRLDHWRRSATCRAAVINSYGPTECTDVVAFHRLAPPDGEGAVPLGRPIPGARLWIQSGIQSGIHSGIAGAGPEPAPIGVPGELWIGGECVGGGYVGDAARTALRFLPEPSPETPGARAYRTGDLARRLPGGEIDYLGRIDHQVKLRGFRVELGEIEAALASQPAVREVAVVAREIHPDRPGDLRLVAYVVPAEGDGSPIVAADLREALAARLPLYMVPSAFAVLPALPLTPSGKVDRRALLDMGAGAEGDGAAAFVAPRTPVEELLAGIWCELLHVERVGARDDFFALGGHSLLATQLASRLRAAFAVEVPLRRIFDAPTLEGLAAEVAAARPGTAGPEEPALLPAVRGSCLPLSFAQERLWFLERFDPGNPSLNIPLAAELVGRLSVPALAATLAELADRHESLRTTFETVAGEPSQKIHPADSVAVPEVDLAALPEAEARSEADRLAGEQALRGFDLERGPLFRAALLRLAEERYQFLLVLHHIISDGWSMGVLLRELGAIYDALSQGQRPSLPSLPIQYADFALWQRLVLAGEKRPELDYWLGRLGGEVEPLELPTDRPRPAIQTYRGGRWPLVLSADLTSRLRAFGRREGATLFMTLLAVAKALLSRQSGQDDVLMGTPIAGRRRLETEGLIGFFLNTLVLRTDLSGSPSLRTLAGRVRAVTLDAYAHQDIPFEAVLAGLKGERDLSRTPLFQVLFNMLNLPRGELRLPGLTLTPVVGPESVPSKFDLTFYVTERGDEIGIELVYNADLFDAARMADLAEQYTGLLAQAVEAPEIPLESLSLVTDRARSVLPDPRAELGTAWVGAVHELFAREARRAPERIAMSDREGVWSYGELDAVADRLAGWLLAQGVAREDRVAIYAHRSAPLVPAVLAALKAGAAFTILDPAYPAARLVDMLALASPRAGLLVSAAGPLPAEVEAWFDAAGCSRLTLSGGLAGLPGLSAELKAIAVGPDDLAYVAFTSGSTGSPKGILGRHGPLTHFLPWMRERFGLSSMDRFTLLSGLAHDPLQRDIFTPLCLGATIVIPDPSEIPVAGRVAAWMAREEATMAHLTPAMAQLIAEPPADRDSTSISSLRLVLLVGEALTRLDVARIRRLAPEVTAVNLFGSTETQRAVGYHVATSEEASGSGRGQPVLALGQGMEDVQLLVLNPTGELAGIGEVGEIAVRSPHLARGYLHDPRLTAEKFRLNPATGAAGDRLYRTGDLGRYLPNGEVTFAGRGDFQVKIRGFRVEPAEIEAALARHPAVAAAAALLREERGERFLVALFVPRPGEEPTPAELREHLLSALPSYMVPTAFARLSALPLTPNGKLDRRALKHLVPALSQRVGEASGAPYAAPRDATEELLADLWSGLLGLDRVGVHDNFFALGGHSLLATRLVSRVREVFGVELPVRALFDTPTVSGLADLLAALLAAGTGAAPPPPLRPAPREGELPLSFAQERLWFLDRLAPGGGAYNISAAVRLTGPLDVAAFGAALGEVVRRHEALRTGFREGVEGPVQVIGAWRPTGLPVIDLSAFSGEAVALRLAREEAGRSFDLTSGRLVRAALLRLAGQHVLLLTLHHIAADGWSLGVLVGELAVLYRAFHAGRPSPLPELSIQYADFAIWQRTWLSGAALEVQMAHWRRALAGAPALALPTDRPRPAVRSSRGARRRVALSLGLSEDLRRLAHGHGATPFMVLLAGFEILLGRQSGQEDLLVGSPIANRTHREIEGLIGFFVNTLVLRADLSLDPDFLRFLGRTREVTLSAYAHQDLPFEKLVSELAPVRDVSRTPLFQVMFNLQNTETAVPGFPDLAAERLEVAGKTVQFDLTLALGRGGKGGFVGSIEYSTDLFDGTTIDRMHGHFETLLEGFTANPQARLSDLPLLTGPERQALLEWNATAASPDADACLHEWIAAPVRRTPDTVAMVFEGAALSYGELAARAGLLARHLRRLGVGPEVTVGVCLERSLELVVGLLGVLEAGGAYLPLDSGYPRERLAHMLEDARPPVVLAAANTVAVLPPHAGRTVLLEGPLPEDASSPAGVRPTPQNLAYVIFTSGSTGRPKGVMVRHRSIVNRVLWTLREFPLTAEDRLLQKTPFSFDASIWEIFAPLWSGARLVMARPGGHQDSAYLAATIAAEGITVLQLVPSLLRVLLDEAGMAASASLRRIFCGGEALPGDLVERCHERLPAALTNLYGPTEVAIDAAFWRCERGAPAAVIPIGRPIENARLYIVDARGELAPTGVPGELRVGGVGLARGYLGRPDLTAERFVPAFEVSGESSEPGARLYRTGDLARHLPGGEIEYLGRIDHQVKIRGFRIELGEIEAALLADPGVSEAVVIAREARPGDLQLVAYVVALGEATAQAIPALRAGLAGRLPYYMLPAAFVFLAALPRTPNGKVDRRALLSPELSPAGREAAYEAPWAGSEERLAAVWVEVLGDRVGRVGRRDNFFALGGDSLLAIRIVTRAREVGLVFTVLQLFERQTIAELAELLRIAEEPALSAAPDPPPTREPTIADGPDVSGADFDQDDLARFLADLTGD
jgi:amino acid adenylation domain-containing protein